MPKRKRHSSAEIAAKLEEANALVAQGKRQQDIARALGISVMTFHRWRKAQLARSDTPLQPASRAGGLDGLTDQDPGQRIAQLELENSRLRRLVTDLLLEKVRLEEIKLEEVASDQDGDSITQASH
jgi:transposase